MRNLEKPWLDQDGKKLATAEIRLISQSWNAATWEKYLMTLEKPQSDVLGNESDFVEETMTSEVLELYKSMLEQDEYPEFRGFLQGAILTLSPQERRVMDHIFWDAMSLADVAKKLGLTKSSVATYKKRATRKLRNRLISAAESQGIDQPPMATTDSVRHSRRTVSHVSP